MTPAASPGLLTHTIDGDGPALLLLNGGLMTYAAWSPLVPAIAPSCRLIRCDFRGQLLSPGEPPSSFEGHADDLLRLVDALAIDAVHVAGTSFGALAAIVLAARAPQRIRSLTAISATDRMTPEMDASTTRLRDTSHEAASGGDGGQVLDLVNPATWSPEFLEQQSAMLAARRQAVAMLPPAWFSGLERLASSMIGLDLRPLLPDIQCPTLVIGGERDRTFPVEHSRELAAHIRGARLHIVPAGPHALVVEHAPTVVPLIVNFVREVEGARGSRTPAESAS